MDNSTCPLSVEDTIPYFLKRFDIFNIAILKQKIRLELGFF